MLAHSNQRGIKIFAITLCLVSASVFAANAENHSEDDEQIIHGNINGYEIPDHGKNISIVGIFTNPHNNFVFEFVFHKEDKLGVSFYDTEVPDHLTRQEELALANSYDLEQAYIQKNHLTRILPSVSLVLPDGKKVSESNASGKTCNWPYAGFMQIAEWGEPPIKQGIFVEYAHPHFDTYERDCEDTIGVAKIATKYLDKSMSFITDGANGFFAIVSDTPYVVHFDSKGRSSYFIGRSDLILVPMDRLVDILSQANNGEISSRSAALSMERIISKVQIEQMKEKQ